MAMQTIVIDNGSGVTKAGLGGESNLPTCIFPALYGTPRNDQQLFGAVGKTEFIGEEAARLKGVLNLVHPIETGIVTDWDIMNKIWDYTFRNELRVDPSEHNVLLTEAPLCPKANREKMAEVMFETFNV